MARTKRSPSKIAPKSYHESSSENESENETAEEVPNKKSVAEKAKFTTPDKVSTYLLDTTKSINVTFYNIY